MLGTNTNNGEKRIEKQSFPSPALYIIGMAKAKVENLNTRIKKDTAIAYIQYLHGEKVSLTRKF